MRRKLIIAAGAGALALTAGLVLLLTRWGNLGPAPKFAVIYEKGSQNFFVALPEGSFPLRANESPRQVFAGQYLYYDAVTSSGTDIYLMNMRDSRSRKEGGEVVAQSVSGEWTVSADGRRAAWVTSRGSVLQSFDAQRATTTELASGVDALYAAPGQDLFFFTKAEGELFRCNLKLGQRPERMAGNVLDVQFFGGQAQAAKNSAGQPVVYYLLPTAVSAVAPAGEAFDLYALGQEGGAVLVAQNPVKALFESYEPGGNLYFLKGGSGALTIDDPQAESDAAMREPQRPAGGGRISKWLANALGANTVYGREKAAYDDKLERDAVRAVAAETLETLPGSGIPLDCWVYDGVSARLLARGVREDRIALLRSLGRPAMLYEKWRGEEGGDVETAISLDFLVEAYRAGGASAVGEALQGLTGGDTGAAGYALAMMAPDGPSEVTLGLDFGGGAGWKAWFLPGGETMLYQARDVEGGLYALYSYEMTDYGLSERSVVDLDTDGVTPAGGGVYYSKREADAKGVALYYYTPDGRTQRVMRGAGTFFPAGDFLLSFDGADKLFRVSGTSSKQLDGGVRLEGVRTGGSHACWFTQWEAGTGTLRLADLGAKGSGVAARTLDTGVTAIRVVK